MRILMVNHEFTRSGASKIFLNLAIHLQDCGHEVTIFPLNPQHGPVRDAYVARGMPIRERLSGESFNLAIANTICAAPFLLQFGQQVRTIWWVHEAEIGIGLILRHPDWAGAFARAAAIVFETPYQRDEAYRPFIANLDQRKIFFIPNGIVVARDDPEAAALVPPATAGALRVVAVGTVEPRKRHADLIHAVAQLQHLAIECIICGTFFNLPPDATALLAQSPERYRLLSGLGDEVVRAWVTSADIFCMPSWSETQGIAAYEAALLGRPLVLTDLPCYRGVFAHGREALLFPVGDIDLLAATLDALATRPALRARLGAAARRSAAPYTQRRFLAEFETVMNVVCA